MRTGIAILLTAGLIGTLAACSPAATTEENANGASDSCEVTASGSLSDAVSVSDDFGTKPTVEIDSPITATETERTVVVEGDGDVAQSGSQVSVNFVLYNGTSGEELSATEYGETGAQTFVVDEAQFLVGLVKTLECSTVGSRVVGVVPPADSWGETGSEDLGVDPADTIVFVADIVSVVTVLDRADGEDQPAEDGFPTVTLADDGTPTVTIPDETAPTDLKISVLKKGDGAEVADGASVTVHYQGINWDTKEIFDQSWGGQPATFLTTGVVEGFGQALVGQTVGSQVLVVIPPALGYGEAGTSDNELAGQTLVFVIDILATT
jgi:peptidylprolyl isomerase